MIKSELVLKIAEQNPHLYQRDVENIVNAILDTIADALARGDRVELRGFGAFSIKRRDARTGRNPSTGETVSVSEKVIPVFKTGKEMRIASTRRCRKRARNSRGQCFHATVPQGPAPLADRDHRGAARGRQPRPGDALLRSVLARRTAAQLDAAAVCRDLPLGDGRRPDRRRRLLARAIQAPAPGAPLSPRSPQSAPRGRAPAPPRRRRSARPHHLRAVAALIPARCASSPPPRSTAPLPSRP